MRLSIAMRPLIIIYLLVGLSIVTSSKIGLRSIIRQSFDRAVDTIVDEDEQSSSPLHYVPLVSSSFNSAPVVRPTRTTRESLPTSCDATGCVLDLATTLNLPMSAGSTHVFELQGTSNTENSKLFFYVSKFDVVYTLDYMYSQPKVSSFAFMGNSDDGSLDTCALVCDEHYLDSASRAADCDGVVNPRRVSSTVLYSDLASKFSCGHWTADDLSLCQSKLLLTDSSEFLSFYTVSNQYYVSAEFCPHLATDVANSTCLSMYVDSAAFPVTLQSDDGTYTIVISSIVDVDDTMVGSNVVAHMRPGKSVLDEIETVPVVDWYYTTGIPAFGTLPSQGLGAVQTRYLDFTGNVSNDVYASSSFGGLDVSWNLHTCDASTATTNTRAYVKMAYTGSVTTVAVKAVSDTISKVAPKTYSKRKSRGTRDCGITLLVILITAAVVAGATVGTLAITANSQTCCSTLSGYTEDYITDLTSYMSSATTRLSSLGFSSFTSLVYTRGQPSDVTISLSATTSATGSMTVRAAGVSLSYVSGSVDDWSYDSIYYFTSSGGSYITITTEVSGSGGAVKLLSKNLVFAVSSFTASFGTNEHTIAVTVIDSTAGYDVCLASFDDCKSPASVSVDTGPSGGESNTETEAEFGTDAGHTDFVFSLWTFSLSYVLWWIILAIIFVVLLIKFLPFLFSWSSRSIKYVFYYLFCCCLFSRSDAATLFRTFNYDFISVVGTSTSDYVCNVAVCDYPLTAISSNNYNLGSFENYNGVLSFSLDYDTTNFAKNFYACNNDDCSIISRYFGASLARNFSAYCEVNSFTSETFANFTFDLPISDRSVAVVPFEESNTVIFIPIYDSRPSVFPIIASCKRDVALSDFDYTVYIVDRWVKPLMVDSSVVSLVFIRYAYYGEFTQAEVSQMVSAEYSDSIDSDYILSAGSLISLDEAREELFVYACTSCSVGVDRAALSDVILHSYVLVIESTGHWVPVVPTQVKSQTSFAVECSYSASFTYCTGSNYYIFSPSPIGSTSYLKTVSASEFRVPLRLYSGTYLFELSPLCTGFIAYDTTGQLVCSSDCCIYTDTAFRNVKRITAGESPVKTFQTTTRTLTYVNSTTSVTATLSEATSCSTATFGEAWVCYIQRYPVIFWLMVALSLLFILIFAVFFGYVLFRKILNRFTRRAGVTNSGRIVSTKSRKIRRFKIN